MRLSVVAIDPTAPISHLWLSSTRRWQGNLAAASAWSRHSNKASMGATVTRASFDLSDDDRAAAQQRLERLGGRYPAIERSRLLLDDDWDGAFRKGLDFLLDGLSPR
jgi:hypothetical protein